MASGVTPVMDFNVWMVAVGDPMTVLFLFNQSISSADQRDSKFAAEEIAEYARSFAPVDTGKLRDSIDTFFSATSGKAGNWGVEVTATNTSGVQYGSFVEYGTRYHEAQPFLRPAIEKADLKGIFANGIWNDPELKAAMRTPVVKSLSMTGRLFGNAGGMTSLSQEALSTGKFTGKFNVSGASNVRWTSYGR